MRMWIAQNNQKIARMNCVYHPFCLQICQKLTSVLSRTPKGGIKKKGLPQPAILFYNLCGELYNTDTERGFSLSSTCPSHLFLNSSLVLHLHQSVEWFKWIKETQLALNKFFLICGSLFYSIQCLDSFTWLACWKHSSHSRLVMAHSSTHVLKLAHCSGHQQVAGSYHTVALKSLCIYLMQNPRIVLQLHKQILDIIFVLY